jgi:vitamin-K-epoxide reductase (warfarin-sensitive)
MKQETTLHIILYLALIGLLVSIYLTAVHFQHTSAVCDISDTLSCSKVSSSKYSEIFNIPVSIFGGLGYTLLAGISFILLRWKFNIEKEHKVYLIKAFLALAFISLLFSLYLSYVEFAIIHTICIFCVISQFIIITITFFAYIYYTKALSNLKEE